MKIIPNIPLIVFLAAFTMVTSCSKEEDKVTEAEPATPPANTQPSSTTAPPTTAPATAAAPTTALPPNHPAMPQTVPTTPQQAPVAPPANPGQAKVLSATHASGYTYMEVEFDGKKTWVAATSLKIKTGDTVQWESASVMNNYTSKTLRRTFPEILFVSKASAVK